MHSGVKELAKALAKLCKSDIVDILIANPEEQDKLILKVIIKNNSLKEFEEASKEIKRVVKKRLVLEYIEIEKILDDASFIALIPSAFSVKHSQLVRKALSAEPILLITYELTNLNHSQKTMFGYALKGRTGESGILTGLKGKAVGRNNILIPSGHTDSIIDFFATWKVKYTVQQFLKVKDEN